MHVFEHSKRLMGTMAVVALLGCGGEKRAAPRESARAPAVVLAPTVTAVRAPVSACRTVHVVEVAVDRRRPEVHLAKDRVGIVHRARSRATFEQETCEPWRTLSVGSVPMSGVFTQTSTTPVCRPRSTPREVIGLGAVVVDDDLYTLDCEYGNGDAGEGEYYDAFLRCRATDVRGGSHAILSEIEIRPPSVPLYQIEDPRVRLQWSRVGDVDVFVAAITGVPESSGVYAAVDTSTRSMTSGRIGFAPSGDIEDRASFAFELAPRPSGGVIVTHGPTAGPRRTRTQIDGDGFVGEREVIEAVVAPLPLDFVVERADRRAPPVVRIARTGVASPILGMAEGATFAPSFARVGDRIVLTWSEGLGEITRIRAAIIDPVRGAIVGPILDLSTAGTEGGYPSIGAHGDRVVVSWDEKRDDHWRVLATELACE